MKRKTIMVVAVALLTGTMASASVVNYWSCDSISGGQVAANVGPDNLASYATVTADSDAKFGAGSLNSPVGSYLYSSTAQNSVDQGTFATWIKYTGFNDWGGLISTNIKSKAVSTKMRIDFGGSASQLYIWDIPTATGTNLIVPTANIADGNWHFLALTYDNAAGECKFYVDGVLDGTAAYSSANAETSGGIQLSTKGMSAADSTGLKIDETAIFDTALTATEVEHYNNNPIPEPATMSLLMAGVVMGVVRRRKIAAK